MTPDEITMFKDQFKHYYSLITDASPGMLYFNAECNQDTLAVLAFEAHLNTEKYPSHKLHRWLGYIQGILIAAGELTVREERERTRPIFHGIYGAGVSFDATSV